MMLEAESKAWNTCGHVKVGVGVLLIRGDRVLVGKRKGSHGAGKYALPGGHLECGESLADCTQREVLEETGIDLSKSEISYVTVTNDIMAEERRHYITLFMKCDCPNNIEPENLEPDKCDGWEFCTVEELKARRLFLPLQHLLESGFSLLPHSAEGNNKKI